MKSAKKTISASKGTADPDNNHSLSSLSPDASINSTELLRTAPLQLVVSGAFPAMDCEGVLTVDEAAMLLFCVRRCRHGMISGSCSSSVAISFVSVIRKGACHDKEPVQHSLSAAHGAGR